MATLPFNDAKPADMATNQPTATSTSTTDSSASPSTSATTPISDTNSSVPPTLASHLTFPTTTSTTSFWRTPPHPLDTHRTTPTLPPKTDILIIGAGMSGISIAYHLLNPSNLPSPPTPSSSPPPSILLLEARQLSSSATGRNGGHCKLPIWHTNHVFHKHGAAAAAELARFQLDHIDALGAVAENEGLTGIGIGEDGKTGSEYLRTVSYDVFMDKDLWARRKAEVQQLMQVDEAGLGKLVRDNVQILDAEDWQSTTHAGASDENDHIERITGVHGRAAGALAVPAASLWPYRLVCGLAERIAGEGEGKVNLQTNTKVTRVTEERDAEGYVAVRTDGRGTVRAKTVVFATNAYTAGVLPGYEGVLLPVKGTAAYVAKQKRSGTHGQGQVRTNTYNIFKANGQVDYLIHRADGGAVVGGAREAYPSEMAAFINTVDDATQINEEGAKRYFVDRMESAWTDWREGGAGVECIWTGIMGLTPDGYPHVGALPSRPGQYVCAGFNGAGMPHIFLSARGVARMIRRGKTFEEVGASGGEGDEGVPRIFKVTEERMQEEWDLGKFGRPKGLR